LDYKFPTAWEKKSKKFRGRIYFTHTVYDHDTSTLQTDGQTTYHGNTTLCLASCGKNITFGGRISKTVGDRTSVPMGHEEEMNELNGPDNVTLRGAENATLFMFMCRLCVCNNSVDCLTRQAVLPSCH